MVRINRVYTKAGDSGQTALIGGEKVSKSEPRIECYGTVDELNATIGMACAALPESSQLVPVLRRIQNELFNLGAQLATPDAERRAGMPSVEERHVEALEVECDEYNEQLPELRSFVLPGGTPAAAALHLARTVCRRAERHVVALARQADVPAEQLKYLNRLSDALFVFSRWVNKDAGVSEPLWEPEET
jgi:cob(I)alamin adenosyltransferase